MPSTTLLSGLFVAVVVVVLVVLLSLFLRFSLPFGSRPLSASDVRMGKKAQHYRY